MKLKNLIVLVLLISSFSIGGCWMEESPEFEDIRDVLKQELDDKKLIGTPLEDEEENQTASVNESSPAIAKADDQTRSIEMEGKGGSDKVSVKKVIVVPIEEENDNRTVYDSESISMPETEKDEEIKNIEKEEKGIYTAKGDESLLKISARKNVYGDPLKWILLYRFNRDAFDHIEKDNTIPDKIIPAETNLKVVFPSDTETISNPGSKNRWVVNILSTTERENVVPDAVKLVDSGFAAYITKASVKGQNYIRLRVGFFNKKSEAENEGRQIMALLNTSDFWITKADDAEFKEYGGYK